MLFGGSLLHIHIQPVLCQPHFSHLLVYMEKINFGVSLCSLLEYFLEKKTPPRLPMQII